MSVIQEEKLVDDLSDQYQVGLKDITDASKVSLDASTINPNPEDISSLPPIAGSLHDDLSSTSTTSSISWAPESITKLKKKSVKFPDCTDDNNSLPLVSFISSSTPVPTSHRRLHSDAVFVKFIEFLERGRPERRFIREGLFCWRRRLFSSKKELVIHLFSDVICFSKKNADGFLYLMDKFKLKQCRAEIDQKSISIACGNSVMSITASSEHIAKGWFNDIQALTAWCQKGEAGIMPVVPSPDLEIAFASTHSRSISVALRDEIITKARIPSRPSSHLRSTSAFLAPKETPPHDSSRQFQMSWEYAVDQMNLMKPVMKSAQESTHFNHDKKIRAAKLQAATEARLLALKAGDYLLKYDRSGNCHQRFYQVDPNGEILSWSKTKASVSSTEKRLELASLSNVVLGPQTKRFQRYLKEGRKTPWLCFSLIPFSQSAETIDLECKSSEQFDCWVLGLQSLIPLWQSTHITHGHLLWIRTMMKLDFFGMTNNLKDRADALRYIDSHPIPCCPECDK